MGNKEDKPVPAKKLDRKEQLLRAKKRREERRQAAAQKTQQKKPNAPKKKKPKQKTAKKRTAAALPHKSRSLVLTLGAAVLLVAGGGAALWFFRAQGPGQPTGAVTFLPQGTLWAYSMTTDARQWERLAQLGTEANQKTWVSLRGDLEEKLLKPQGLTYAEHVAPWIGDQITMASLPPTLETAETFVQTAPIWVLPMRSKSRAESSFINPLLSNVNPQQRTHQGVDIQEFQASDQQNYAIATLDNRYLVITLAGVPIDQVIETFKGKPSIATSPRYAEAMAEVHASRPLLNIYVNLPLAAAQMAANSEDPTLSEEALAKIQSVSGLGSTITLDQDTLQVKAISWLAPDAKQSFTAGEPTTLARRIPSTAMVMLAGNNFKALWDAYEAGTPAQLLLPFDPNQWATDFRKTTDIDFAKTFIPWMDREFAGAILPVAEKSSGVGIALLAQTSDRTAANQAWQKLDDAMREKFQLQITGTDINETSVINWRVPPGLPIATHGWLTDRLSFLAIGAPITEQIIDTSGQTLAETGSFKSATQSGLKPSGQFYVNMSPTLAEMKTNPLFPKLAPEALQFAEGIETIGATTAIHETWGTRYDVRVKLKNP